MTMTPSHAEWTTLLETPEFGQGHLLANATTDTQKKQVLEQVMRVDETYPGGVRAYIQNSRKLLKDSQEGKNPFEGFSPKVPLVERVVPGTQAFTDMELAGETELARCGFVLVAGGLGERLGYPGIKLALPVESVSGTTYLQYYIEWLLAIRDFNRKTNSDAMAPPLAIMVSGDTHQGTLDLLEDNDYFGFPRCRLSIMKQEKVPALLDNEARFALSEQGGIQTKPHGHGDVHTLLLQEGIIQKWNQEGLRWCMFFQDTNALAFRSLACMLGVSATHDLTMNTLAVGRKAKEAVGAICTLEGKTGEALTVNVEYNQLGPLLVDAGMGGDVADPTTGESLFPGNTNILLFQIPQYYEVLTKTNGAVPEFVNPKYADAEHTKFKAPTRLECMMQDIPKLFSKEHKVGVTQLPRWACFSTVKNNTIDAAAKLKAGGVPESAFSGEVELFECNCRLLDIASRARRCPTFIGERTTETWLDIVQEVPPMVVLKPSFGVSLEDVKRHIKEGSTVSLAAKSFVQIDGDFVLSGLQVDGSLTIAGRGESAYQSVNKGIRRVAAGPDAPARTAIRGFVYDEL
ncbi:MAG: hypothetical protein KVP17_004243 [Porospora cf. gigantea B]|uniref:uncharacterized protein n=1 Tax=Porospora cf. gigantea B TaxID=2853592 RepID=UPI003571B981|nr:MAG: hypothetical protein KVP17_004243 [Porospora cf. gigantea B]